MSEAQNLGISLDQKSVEILKKVDAIHRDSIINVGLALVSKTGYYKTLAGINEVSEEDLEEVASLEVNDETSKQKKESKTKAAKESSAPAKKPASNWDSF